MTFSTKMNANCTASAFCVLKWEAGAAVLVDSTGEVITPEEAGAVNVAPIGPEDEEESELIEAAAVAGYTVYA
jgi:hypothetical protein